MGLKVKIDTLIGMDVPTSDRGAVKIAKVCIRDAATGASLSNYETERIVAQFRKPDTGGTGMLMYNISCYVVDYPSTMVANVKKACEAAGFTVVKL